jgi:hypothetical protein
MQMANHHRLYGRHLDPGLKAELAQAVRAPIGGGDAGRVISRVGGDAWNSQELEQPVERSLPLGGEVIEHAR